MWFLIKILIDINVYEINVQYYSRFDNANILDIYKKNIFLKSVHDCRFLCFFVNIFYVVKFTLFNLFRGKAIS